jgi:tetratricopeptide (TPR) repeat protein
MTDWKVFVGTILIGFSYPFFGQAQSAESLAEDYYKRGEVLFDLDDASEETYDVAIQYYQKAIDLLEEARLQTITLAQCHQRIGSIYLDRDALDQAMDEYHQSLSIKAAIPNLNDSLLYSDCVFLGNIHYYLDRYDSASYYYDKAEKIAVDADEQIADIERIYNSLGVFNFTLGNYQKAITYHDKALSVMPQEGFDFIIAQSGIFLQYRYCPGQIKSPRRGYTAI